MDWNVLLHSQKVSQELKSIPVIAGGVLINLEEPSLSGSMKLIVRDMGWLIKLIRKRMSFISAWSCSI